MRLIRSLAREATGPGQRFRLLGAVTGLLALVAICPIPNRRFASGWLQPSQARGVFVSTAGQLQDCLVGNGQSVTAGQTLFRLQSSGLQLQSIQRNSQVQAAKQRYRSMKRQRDMYGEDIDLRPADSDIDNAISMAASADRDLSDLQLTSPVTGEFYAARAPVLSDHEEPQHNFYSSWADANQWGRSLVPGTLLGMVCSQQRMAVIPLSETQLSDIASGTSVSISVASHPGQTQQLTVEQVVHLEEIESFWSTHQSTASGPNHSHAAEFAAVVSLPDDSRYSPGASVEAVFSAPTQTLASLSFRWLRSNMRLLAD